MIEYLVALFRHMLLHEKDKPYSCHFESCGERFAKHSQLRRHLCDHTGEAPYACTESPGCSKTFHFPAQLRRHIDSVHKSMYSAPYKKKTVRLTQHCTPSEELKYVCGEENCIASFVSHRELVAHVKENHKRKLQLTCEECNQTFTHRASLKHHMSTHAEERPLFACEICGREYTKVLYIAPPAIYSF